MAQNLQTHKTPQDLTISELRKQLITNDYGGCAWKEECLNELINREVDIAFTGISYPDSN